MDLFIGEASRGIVDDGLDVVAEVAQKVGETKLGALVKQELHVVGRLALPPPRRLSVGRFSSTAVRA